jgi:uncharacterized protein (TIGR04255 family)
MSRLPNAPLIEVIFELRWNPLSVDDQYLHGDLYPLINSKYPYREVTNQIIPGPIPISGIIHRFRVAQNDYPLVQVSQGLITVNTIDSKYSWNEYEMWITDVLEKFDSISPLNKRQSVRLALHYIDLIKFDFDNSDVYKFLSERLHINISQSFYKPETTSKNIGLVWFFENQLGALTIGINRGQNQAGDNGIGIQSVLNSNEIKPEIEEIKTWLKSAHIVMSKLFKNMTEGQLQHDFSSK